MKEVLKLIDNYLKFKMIEEIAGTVLSLIVILVIVIYLFKK